MILRLDDLVKVGTKGPRLPDWAHRHGLDLPEAVYAVRAVGDRGVLARVGKGEAILECAPDDPLLCRVEAALGDQREGVYRIEQQSVSLEARGEPALAVFRQTCGVDLAAGPPDRVVYARVAGVSCALLERAGGGERTWRIWVDRTYADYLSDTLAEIAASVEDPPGAGALS